MFEIQSRSGHWGWEAIEALRELGEDWEFETEAEAWEAIEALRAELAAVKTMKALKAPKQRRVRRKAA